MAKIEKNELWTALNYRLKDKMKLMDDFEKRIDIFILQTEIFLKVIKFFSFIYFQLIKTNLKYFFYLKYYINADIHFLNNF